MHSLQGREQQDPKFPFVSVDIRVQAQVYAVRSKEMSGREDRVDNDISRVQADYLGDASVVDDGMICI